MLSLRTSHQKAYELISERIALIKKIRTMESGEMNDFHAVQWIQTTLFVIEEIYNDERHARQFRDAVSTPLPRDRDLRWEGTWAVHLGGATLSSFLEEINIVLRLPEFIEPFVEKVPKAVQESLKKFEADFPNPENVAFIMMQFGETEEYTKILISIKKTLKENGLIGLRADDKEYNADKYYNILTYLHGCTFGIAVFEKISDETFNPNVSLEVGYLLALNKQVCLLKEKTLPNLTSDLVGKLYREFNIEDCDISISNVLRNWLDDQGFLKTVDKK
jgi:hypothetical protein